MRFLPNLNRIFYMSDKRKNGRSEKLFNFGDMKNIIGSILCLAVLSLSSCKKEKITLYDADYLVFGHFYGECMGERCVEIYRLEKDHLFEDTKDQYPSFNEFYTGIYVPLSQQNFNDTKDLMNDFPMSLIDDTAQVIGYPDAGDWGGLYIEYNFNEVSRYWILDQMKDNVPAQYHAFIDRVNEKIDRLP